MFWCSRRRGRVSAVILVWQVAWLGVHPAVAGRSLCHIILVFLQVLKMSTPLKVPPTVYFGWYKISLEKNCKPIDIYWQVCEVYGNDIMTAGIGAVRQWYIMFKTARTSMHNEEQSGWANL